MGSPNTLHEAIQYFGDYENCRKFMMEVRWPDGVVKCPQCGSEKVTYLEKARLFKCYGRHEKAKFSLKTGTIFEDSPIALDKWLTAVWLIVNCKNGISSYEIARDLGVTQKSAWFMLQRIRLALQEGSFRKLSGQVEVDESFIGGKARNMHKSKRDRVISGSGPVDKEIVFGMVERDGHVRVMHLPSRRKNMLQSTIRDHVEAGSAIFSDELLSYEGLSEEFQHAVINHAVEYANGNVHTNTMENFWSLLKRGLQGTYISVEPFHLFRYLDEQAFRYNNRKLKDAERFQIAVGQIVGKRLMYEELIGKTGPQGSETN
jgi:transposase-like protein